MLSSVLTSDRAIQVNMAIMRAFVRMRQALADHGELAMQVSLLEQRMEGHDADINVIFETIQKLIQVPEGGEKRRIGFPA